MQAFDATNHYFDRAAKLLDLSNNVRTLLVTPDREVRVELVIELDSGEIGNFIGYRVQHDNARGPFKGGLRYHPLVDQVPDAELARLAESVRGVVASCVAVMPPHEQFIARCCQAPVAA